MANCYTCKADEVCNHDIFGFENCNNYIPADVVEVIHGKWKKHRDDGDCEYIECSVCREEFYPPDNEFVFDRYPNYCPNCGAKMDGGKKR